MANMGEDSFGTAGLPVGEDAMEALTRQGRKPGRIAGGQMYW